MAEVLLILTNKIVEKPETIFEPRDFAELLEQYLGYDASRYFRKLVETLQTDETPINGDLDSYESSLDSNLTAFQSVQEEVFEMLSYCHELACNPTKYKAVQPIVNKLKKINQIINNQI